MAVKNLDLRGEICPDPLTLTMKEIANIAPGDRLNVTVDSPTAVETISRWAKNAGHRLIEVKDAGPAQWEIAIEKVGT